MKMIKIIVNDNGNTDLASGELFHSYNAINIPEADFWGDVCFDFSEKNYYQICDSSIDFYLQSLEEAEYEKNRIDSLLTVWA